MDDIYSLLNLPKNASREELKTAFITWKKSQQQILQSGTRDEQAVASKRIGEMTKLYKEACGISDSTNIPKSPTVQSGNNQTDSKINKTTVSDVLPDSSSTSYEVNKQKILNIVLCAVIVILSAIVLYLYNPKGSFIAIPSVLQNLFNSHENSGPVNSNTANTISPSHEKEQVISVNPQTENTSSEEKKSDKPTVEDRNTGKNPAQREAIQTLLDFHENITKKSLRQAYDCMSYNLQGEISYEGWAPGFRDTISSTPTNIKVVSELPDKIVLTYDLTAVDKPNITATFAGTAVIIKTSSGWKIDDVINKNK